MYKSYIYFKNKLIKYYKYMACACKSNSSGVRVHKNVTKNQFRVNNVKSSATRSGKIIRRNLG